MKTKNFIYTFLLISILSISMTSYAQTVTEEWVARYNGPGNGLDVAFTIAVDGSGSVYMAGYSVGNGTDRDYATIKYNSSGVQQWVARYNGPGNGDDRVFSLAIDSFGNVYVTGRSTGSGTDNDYATIKYNSSGVQQWVARYNGPGNNRDVAYSLAIDGSGNVYVTGESTGSGTSSDYATIKYNSSGVQQWVARYNGPGNSDDAASSLAVDGLGNVYVTGASEGSGTWYDYATIKYNSSGIQQWIVRYNGTGFGYDYANSLAIDVSGNVYVTGESSGSGTSTDYATIKYNSSGIQQWVTRYNGSVKGQDAARTLSVDITGNVYVTGGSIESGQGFDYATIKYNSEGVEQWVARYNGPGNNWDVAYSLAVDGSGNVYVTGQSWGIEADDYATIKYNSSGVEQWIVRYNGPGNSADGAYSLAVDSSGNVYVTGFSSGIGTSRDYATIKYSQTVGINIISTEIPSSFSLSQNYPNPFNPTTNIRFDIQKQGLVTLKVYDNLGRTVRTLINESLQPGTYEKEFDATRLTSGVYFYRLEANEFSNVKRMLLLK